ncbi:hypothetical protein BCV69DRAFT_285032 [Microstroma glucosiphilum]|uniref:Protein kinase domain-containing protein n=1 Tax=Pseudomicrostroma glucosiphilum TaxID=1684307 RepID=A0A316TYR2_9BASI|nr:hypothetical protein BCV69DRAFT_285032 [Pseudomicrostroma glucosiphilum]PWN18406.1 hypothetical protein BCV69DRAFT_285032 [Pseudomicrostroma glucosiphilum]
MPSRGYFHDVVIEESEEDEELAQVSSPGKTPTRRTPRSGSLGPTSPTAEHGIGATGSPEQPAGSSTSAGISALHRPGPSVLTGLSHSKRSTSEQSAIPPTASSGSPSPSSSAGRVPAAGAGTRTGPRPVPRSSSSLRHVSSTRTKTLSFGALPEDGPSSSSTHYNDTGSTVQRRIDANARRRREMLQQEDFWAAGSDDEERDDGNAAVRPSAFDLRKPLPLESLDSDEADSDTIIRPATRGLKGKGANRNTKGSGGTHPITGASARNELNDSTTEDEHRFDSGEETWSDAWQDEVHDETPRVEDERPRPPASQEPSAEDSLIRKSHPPRYLNQDPGGPSSTGPRRAPWHPRGPRNQRPEASPPLMARTYSGVQTPGFHYPAALNTPMEDSPGGDFPEYEPRQRLEWQTMLESVLASEVLRSETKRITSVDAPDLSREQLMYRRWLDIRASLRGRGHQKGAVDSEEKRLKDSWPEMLKSVVQEVKACRAAQEAEEVEAAKTAAVVQPDSEDGRISPTAPAPSHEHHSKKRPEIFSEEKDEEIFQEIGDLLVRVDAAESQFPSSRKVNEVLPAWNEPAFQLKLEALRAWHNTKSLLRLHLKILKEWTGSETLEIDVPQKSRNTKNDDAFSLLARVNGDVEGTTFVERILKEDSLQSTFENRTLNNLNNLVIKTRDTIKQYHNSFCSMKLPSFAPELVELISFPMRLMEGALRLRLDYAGKIKEPSLLIIDSLTDDLRSALNMALRTKQSYQSIMVPDPLNGWDLHPSIGQSYDVILRDALRFFFRLISFKLKGSIFFKETEILDNEWLFLSNAVSVIEGGDVIVAKSITKIVNKLFARICTYFERELSAPSTTRGKSAKVADSTATGPAPPGTEVTGRGPSLAGGLTKGTVHLTLSEKVKWIHAVFDNVRIRSRKLLGFARDIRNRLDNSAEYDLGSLRPPSDGQTDNVDAGEVDGAAGASAAAKDAVAQQGGMDLNRFLQTLINANYFLVYTETYEEQGIYIIAEPSLHDKPEVIQELLGKCLIRVTLAPRIPTQADPVYGTAEEVGGTAEGTNPEEGEVTAAAAAAAAARHEAEEEPPRYLLLLTPRDPFLWTGRVMTHRMDPVEVNLGERRLRLIADGSKERLAKCKKHFYNVFATTSDLPPDSTLKPATGRPRKGTTSASAPPAVPTPAAVEEEMSVPAGFPLEVISEHMAHMADVQQELRSINKGVYMLSNTILNAVPGVRRNMRGRHLKRKGNNSSMTNKAASDETDELIQNCFSMAAEQGFRSLPFIESARLRGYMTLALARQAIDWVGFICDDCIPSDRKTFKWAVAALENAVQVTRNENIFHLNEDDFNLMRTKVASCVALLISHFDILGARSSVAKAKEEEHRLTQEKADRAATAAAKAAAVESGQDATVVEQRHVVALKLIEGMGGAGPPPMLNRADSGMEATEERWVTKMIEWDQARQAIESEQRLIGRVLDDTRLEDQGLQFLASSSSRIQIRWQQGRFIGGGTFGTVYLAVNLDSGGLMAVKEIRFQDISSTPSMYKSIKDEMDVMEMLSHPNIVEYYGIEVHRDKVYIFEEYCQGGSLGQLLEHGRIEDEAVIQVYTLQMLDGLVYLHSQGVVHRDIKPDNILLDHEGVIKFVDFGAAKVLAKNTRTVQRSRRTGFVGGGAGNMAGMVGPDGKPVGAAAVQSLQGTPMYMSPEVIKGENKGRRGAMDVWSLGCVVLEFATGRRPWSQLDNEWAIMFHIGMAQQHPPLPEPGQLSEQGIDFIRQCLMIDPYDRPSAAEMREHPWIQDLVEQLNAAAIEEDAASSMADGASSVGINSVDYSASGAGSGGGGGAGSGGAGGGNSALSSLSSSTVPIISTQGHDSAAGVAAMAATPATRSINSFIASRPPTGF